jgi:hypothetical protein
MTRLARVELPRGLFALLFFAAVAWTALPLWAAGYLPIEDLPQHLAAIRVLHSYHDPAFGFERYFELELFRTQYLAYYLLGDWLAYFIDLELGNRLLIIACVVATPYALRYLLKTLGRPEWLALFALPLAYNAHLILGFVTFLMAIPAALWGLGLVARQRSVPSAWRPPLLAAVALFCFLSHVVPFAFLLLGCGLLALGSKPLVSVRLLAPLLPSMAAAALWLAESPAGRATWTAAHGGGGNAGPQPIYQPAAQALRDLPNWLSDTFQGEDDAHVLAGSALVLALTLLLGLLAALYRWREPRAPGAYLFLRLLPLAPLAALCYFIAPSAYDWIWPIAQRFPLLALIFAIPLLPAPPRAAALVLTCALLALSWQSQALVTRAFAAFDQQEVGEFDAALATIPNGKRVLGLIYARGSSFVKLSPFIHFVAYYQARKGGAVMFTFADFPQSPFRFRESNRPPRVPPRWEWLPQHVRADDMQWYEYVLVRGGQIPCREPCQQLFGAGMWAVYRL